MFSICLVGQVFLIDNRYQYIEELCRDYLCDSIVGPLISLSETEYVSSDEFSPCYWEAIVIYRKICEYMIRQDVLPFHSSALAMDGIAYIFTAPSGTGKSTHSRLWRERFGDRVIMINDDKPLLSFESGIVRVWGTPWCGKDGYQTNISVPLGGIIVLHQAEDNEIRPLSREEAFPLLLRQSWLPEDMVLRSRAISLIDKLSRMNVYSMGCNISQEAAEMAYNTLVSDSSDSLYC